MTTHLRLLLALPLSFATWALPLSAAADTSPIDWSSVCAIVAQSGNDPNVIRQEALNLGVRPLVVYTQCVAKHSATPQLTFPSPPGLPASLPSTPTPTRRPVMPAALPTASPSATPMFSVASGARLGDLHAASGARTEPPSGSGGSAGNGTITIRLPGPLAHTGWTVFPLIASLVLIVVGSIFAWEQLKKLVVSCWCAMPWWIKDAARYWGT
jgi:hypothetical protein